VDIQDNHFPIAEHFEPVYYAVIGELEEHIPLSVYVHETFGLARTVDLYEYKGVMAGHRETQYLAGWFFEC
jgi:hypothetical protein